ncbi:MAG TPA: hypothetical protein DEG17_14550 [Cyanobacteria bacterium UBA11149]|nr:hypothetical protein [Cyanobacteria bacterium UBA11367]HBE57663.1 hypothetical protein [Cyanobacteria bacterium UBA11366]HBK62079.1 hypothetical protein [Cyanobacteria bacterium UBA11166]HBR76372.1 hypothetical protein [Cyanobacteria bacterium UBA11159]HBS71676.1 hypothetical protein [Cyanobacteria bacterium UBA11153]HBW90058.1 hypothetical protein [Cyanobacteria bacterium UBA11149]HCA94870.1 hypothetical protein [Cyanobacteria bacterium UBA9226]
MNEFTPNESNGKESAQGITKITVSGFKSLYEECSIEVRPLTILAGANSSGKSSIMQPLLLMKQTLEATYDPGALLINGSHVKFTLAEQLFSCIDKKIKANIFSIKIEKNSSIIKESDPFIQVNFELDTLNNTIEIVEMIVKIGGDAYTICPTMGNHEIIEIIPNLFWGIYKQIAKLATLLNFIVIRNRCFLNFEASSSLTDPFSMPFNLASFVEPQIRKLIHVPGLRDNPERSYNVTAVGNDFPGRFDNYVASIINRWKNYQDYRLRNLETALKTLGLTSKIDAVQVNDVQIELRVSRLPESDNARDLVSIADVGVGVSQVLPVLVALLVAQPGQLVYLEQPEIHLHPRAQAALADILADAANRGVRVVVETHSDLLLRRVQSLVAEDKISPDKIKLHWFTRGEDGMTKVNSADLDDAGTFGDWPADFGDVDLQEESRYLDAAEARLWKRSHDR